MRFILPLTVVALSALASLTTARPLAARGGDDSDVNIPARIVAESKLYNEIQSLERLVDEAGASLSEIEADWKDFFDSYEKSHYQDSYYLENIRHRGLEKTTLHDWKHFLSYLSSLASESSDHYHGSSDHGSSDHGSSDHSDSSYNDPHSDKSHSDYVNSNPHPDNHDFLADSGPVTTTSTGIATGSVAPITTTSTAPPLSTISTASLLTTTSIAPALAAFSTASLLTTTSTAPPLATFSTASLLTTTSTTPPLATTSTVAGSAAPLDASSLAVDAVIPITTTSTAPITTTSTAPVATSTVAPITTTSTAPVATGTVASVLDSTNPNPDQTVTYGELDSMLNSKMDELEKNIIDYLKKQLGGSA